MRALVFLVTATALACTQPAASPPKPDASDASPNPAGDAADQVCGHLAQVGCALPSTCAAVYRADQGKLTDFKPACLIAASTPAAVNACGTMHCTAVTQ